MRRFVIYVIIGLSLWLGWEAFARLKAIGTMTPELAQLVKEGRQVDVVVELGFEPEAIHLRLFQKFGRLVGVDKNRVHILDVSPPKARILARYYWIRQLDVRPVEKGNLLPGGGRVFCYAIESSRQRV